MNRHPEITHGWGIEWYHSPFSLDSLGRSQWWAAGTLVDDIPVDHHRWEDIPHIHHHGRIPSHWRDIRHDQGPQRSSRLWVDGSSGALYNVAPFGYHENGSLSHYRDQGPWTGRPMHRGSTGYRDRNNLDGISIFYPDEIEESVDSSTSAPADRLVPSPLYHSFGNWHCDMTNQYQRLSHESDPPASTSRHPQRHRSPSPRVETVFTSGSSSAAEEVPHPTPNNLFHSYSQSAANPSMSSPTIPAFAPVPPLAENIEDVSLDGASEISTPLSHREKKLHQALRREKQEHEVTKMALRELALRGRDGTIIDLASFGIREDDSSQGRRIG